MPKEPKLPNIITRTISSFLAPTKDKVQNRILEFMTREAKNIHNVSIFHTNIFTMYQNNIFKDIYTKVTKKEITDPNTIDEWVYKLYDLHYRKYILIKPTIEHNRKIIYRVIINYLDKNNIIITNDTFNKTKSKVTNILQNDKRIRLEVSQTKSCFTDIINNIFNGIYSSNFYKVKNQILNKKPVTIKDTKFIEQVKKDEFLLKEETHKSYKFRLSECSIFIPKIKTNKNAKDETKVKKPNYIKSNQNYIARIIYKYYLNPKIPSDLMCNIIAKIHASFSSYYALRKKGMFARKPQYLAKNDHFVLPYFCRSMKLIDGFYRLTIGSHVAHHYSQVVKSNQYICLNENDKGDYKKYVHKQYLIPNNGNKVSKSENFVFEDFHIGKNSKYIIDGYYLYVKQPPKLEGKKLKLIEVVPVHDDGSIFKINFVYEDKKTENEPEEGSVVSVDFGMGNLMAIHDPKGPQYLIKGSHIINTNNYYNVLIDTHKKQLSTYGKTKRNETFNTISVPKDNSIDELIDKTFDFVERVEKSSGNAKCVEQIFYNEAPKTSAKLRFLCKKRTELINNQFNDIVNWFTKTYSKCETVVVGYNEGWKTKVNLGRKINRRFYEIPYAKLVSKLRDKLEQNNQKLVVINEAYTSKCDGLILEPVCKQNTYMGTREKRGLFSSATPFLYSSSKKKFVDTNAKGVYLNADINGAINILRKWRVQNGLKDCWIKGTNLCNPISINLGKKLGVK